MHQLYGWSLTLVGEVKSSSWMRCAVVAQNQILETAEVTVGNPMTVALQKLLVCLAKQVSAMSACLLKN